MTKTESIKKDDVPNKDGYLNKFFQPKSFKEYGGLEIGPYDRSYLS